jgi:hypothetical protein
MSDTEKSPNWNCAKSLNLSIIHCIIPLNAIFYDQGYGYLAFNYRNEDYLRMAVLTILLTIIDHF